MRRSGPFPRRHEIRAFSCRLSLPAPPGCLAARINRFEKQDTAFSDHRHDVDIPVDLNLVQKLVRELSPVRVLQHLNELAAFDQGDDLRKADPALPDEPSVFLWIKGVIPLLHAPAIFMTMCACCRFGTSRSAGHSAGHYRPLRLSRAASDVGATGCGSTRPISTASPRPGPTSATTAARISGCAAA